MIDYAKQRAAIDAASQVRGRHFTEWVDHLNELKKAKLDDEALPLLMDIIAATERAALIRGVEPAPGYTERVAVILRRRKDYTGEVAILERWIAACPPERRGGSRTEARLEKARSLSAGQSGNA